MLLSIESELMHSAIFLFTYAFLMVIYMVVSRTQLGASLPRLSVEVLTGVKRESIIVAL